jgi:transposase
VRQAIASAVPPPRQAYPARARPALDPWREVIDAWLEADRSLPRKQRHTARRVWQRLVDEHGADVGESTVRRYVKVVRERHETPLIEVAVPQRHPLGEEAEVDFGSIHVYLAGVLTEVAMFVMRLSASGRAFACAYLNEAQEVFLDGHVRAFEHFGGVPERVRYDNLKAAVVKVLKGRDRIESDRFVAMRSHYGFESFFCLPGIGGAHEKGGVEGEIGRFRRRHLVPIPKVASMAQLNELLVAAALVDDRRHIAHRRITVGEHFVLEAAALGPLPTEHFDVTVIGSNRVDTKSRVCVRQVHYSVPVRYVRQRLDVRVGAETIEVLDGARVVARHARGRKGDEVLVPGSLPRGVDPQSPAPYRRATRTGSSKVQQGAFTADASSGIGPQARRDLGDGRGTRATGRSPPRPPHPGRPTASWPRRSTPPSSPRSLAPDAVIIDARARASTSGHGRTRACWRRPGTGYDRPAPSPWTGYDHLLTTRRA